MVRPPNTSTNRAFALPQSKFSSLFSIERGVKHALTLYDKWHPRSDAGPQSQESLDLIGRSSDYRNEVSDVYVKPHHTAVLFFTLR